MAQLGIRNNNWLNVRYNPKNPWVGQTGGDDSNYAEFENPVYGIRAADKVLANYQKLHGIDNVADTINRYAPPSDNNPTQSYVDYVSDKMGVKSNDSIDLSDPDVRARMMRAMVGFETPDAASQFSDELLAEARSISGEGASFRPTQAATTGKRTFTVRDKVSGKTLKLSGTRPPTNADLQRIFAPYRDSAGGDEDRTILGQAVETVKAIPRGFGHGILSSVEGAVEVADAATNFIGLDSLIDSGDENELIRLAHAGQESLSTGFLGADEAYQDAWMTKFGEGLGSMASFMTPAGAARLAGLAGKGLRMTERAGAVGLATTMYAGEQAQRIKAAREAGIEVSEGQEDAAIIAGAFAGLTELAPIHRLLSRIPKAAGYTFGQNMMKNVTEAMKSGGIEGLQEVVGLWTQNAIERGIYNEDLPTGQSMWEEFTIGGAVGMTADLVLTAFSGRRARLSSEAEKNKEAKLREEVEEASKDLPNRLSRQLKDEADAAAVVDKSEDGGITPEETVTAAADEAEASSIPPDTIQPPYPLRDETQRPPEGWGTEYAKKIAGTMGKDFPSNASFSVDPIAGEQKEKAFAVVSGNKQYGMSQPSVGRAKRLAQGLNKEVSNERIRASVTDILRLSPQSYSESLMGDLYRYGLEIMNPESYTITSASLDEAAGTTNEQARLRKSDGKDPKTVYQETLSAKELERLGEPLRNYTASQKYNHRRMMKGLPEVSTFTAKEAKQILKDKFSNLDNANLVSETERYVADVDQSGDHYVRSSSGEQIRSRLVRGNLKPIETVAQARATAQKLMKNFSEKGQIPREVKDNLKGTAKEIERLLRNKNISSSIDSPEVRQMAQKMVGKLDVRKMNSTELKMLYQRLRKLPRLSETTRLPMMRARSYTKLQWSRALEAVKTSGDPSVENIQQAARFRGRKEITALEQAKALRKDLVDQGVIAKNKVVPYEQEQQARKAAETEAAILEQKAIEEQEAAETTQEEAVDEVSVPNRGLDDLRAALRKSLDSIGLTDIGINLSDVLEFSGRDADGNMVVGARFDARQNKFLFNQKPEDVTEAYYDPGVGAIFLGVDKVSQMDSKKNPMSQEQIQDALADLMNHESLHAMRKLDLFKENEWFLLENAARRLKRRDNNLTFYEEARRSYSDQSETIRMEEAIAELIRHGRRDPKLVGGKPKNLIDRVIRFLERVYSAMRGTGYQSYGDIIASLESGEIGGRERGTVRTLLETELRAGKIPERGIGISDEEEAEIRDEQRKQLEKKAKSEGVSVEDLMRRGKETIQARGDTEGLEIQEGLRESRRASRLDERVESGSIEDFALAQGTPAQQREVRSFLEDRRIVTPADIREARHVSGDAMWSPNAGVMSKADDLIRPPLEFDSDLTPRANMLLQHYVYGSKYVHVNNKQAINQLDDVLGKMETEGDWKNYRPVNSKKLFRSLVNDLAINNKSYQNIIKERLTASSIPDKFTVYRGRSKKEPRGYGKWEDDFVASVSTSRPVAATFAPALEDPAVDAYTVNYEDIMAFGAVSEKELIVRLPTQPDSTTRPDDQAEIEAERQSQFIPDVGIREARAVSKEELIDVHNLSKGQQQTSLFSTLYNENLKPAVSGSVTIPNFLKELQAKIRKQYGGKGLTENTEKNRETVARILAAEAEVALQDPSNYADWYKESLNDMTSVMALKYPELAPNTEQGAENRGAFKIALAVLSNGESVPVNLRLADKAYQYFKDNGVFPITGNGAEAAAAEKGFSAANALIAEFGFKNTLYLLNTDFMVRDLAYMGFTKPSATKSTDELPLSAIFGRKIGGGFFPNLMGRFDLLTTDRWFMRTWGRVTGNLITGDASANLKKLRSNLTEEEADFYDIDRASVLRDDDYAIDAANKIFNKMSSKSVNFSEKRKTKAFSAARSLKTMLAGDISPKSVKQMEFVNDSIGRAREILSDERGIDLDVASFQALIWQPEQRFYEKMGIRLRNLTLQDYAVSARFLIEEHLTGEGEQSGRIQERIEKAIADGKGRASDRGRLQPEELRGKTQASPEEQGRKLRSKFIKRKVVRGLRSGFSRSKDAKGKPGAYTRKAGEAITLELSDGTLGSVIAESVYSIRGGTRASNAFNAAGITPVTFLEITDSTGEGAKVFEKAITLAKKENDHGAAVYVYPVNSTSESTGYSDMRLFLSEDTLTGFAINDGDIVSLFKSPLSPDKLTSVPALFLATQEGGNRLDAFDTELPHLYSMAGFEVVSRLPWNEKESPKEDKDRGLKGWNKEDFAEWNDGEPDVVFMTFTDRMDHYNPSEGQMAESYEEAVSIQEGKETVEARAPPVFDVSPLTKGLDKIRPDPRPIPLEGIEEAVAQNIREGQEANAGLQPKFSQNASPEAQYVARNPDKATPLSDSMDIKYSRSAATPVHGKYVNKYSATHVPDSHPIMAYIRETEGTWNKIKVAMTAVKQRAINNWARLEAVSQDPRLRDLYGSSSAMAAALMSDRSRGLVASALKYGVPVYKNGVMRVVNDIKGTRTDKQLTGVMDGMVSLFSNSDLTGNPDVNLEKLAQAYAAAKRESSFDPEKGIIVKVTAEEQKEAIEEIQAEVDQYINSKTGKPIVEEWYAWWQDYNENTIQWLQDTGVVNAETAEIWRAHATYYPFYEQAQQNPNVQNHKEMKVFAGMTSSAQFERLKGSKNPLDVPLLEAVTRNLSAAMDMGMKNVAQQRIIRDQVEFGMARNITNQPDKHDRVPVVRFMVDGTEQIYEIDDPLIHESMLAMGQGDLGWVVNNIFGPASQLLRETVTRDPAFVLVNMMRDTMSAYVTSGSNFVPVVDTVKGFFGSDMQELEMLGVVGGYDFSNDPKDVVKFMKRLAAKRGTPIGKINREGELDIGGRIEQGFEAPVLKQFKQLWQGMGAVTTQSDAATRRAVYNDVLARTGDLGEAQIQALEIINFSRRGNSTLMRTLTAAIPFLNARMQGVDVLWRSFTGRYSANKEAQNMHIIRTAIFRGGTLMAATSIYYLLVSDEDEYKDARPEVRDDYFIVPLKSIGMDTVLRLPVPFEVGLIFKTIPERILDSMLGDSTSRDVKNTVVRGITSTLEVNPLQAQAFAPIIESWLNHDFYTGRSIVPMYMDQDVASGLQDTFGTRELAVKIGKALNLSPIKIDHIMTGYAGTLGVYGLDVIDAFMRTEGRIKPERRLDQYPVIKRFFASPRGGGLQAQFYELNNQVRGVVTTMNRLKRQGRYDELNAFMKTRQGLVEIRGNVNYIAKEMAEYRRQRSQIQRSNFDPETKREMLEVLEAEINLMLKVAPELKRIANVPAFERTG